MKKVPMNQTEFFQKLIESLSSFGIPKPKGELKDIGFKDLSQHLLNHLFGTKADKNLME